MTVEPPVPLEVEVPKARLGDAELAAEIEKAVRSALVFRCKVQLVAEEEFGEAGYKTRLVRQT